MVKLFYIKFIPVHQNEFWFLVLWSVHQNPYFKLLKSNIKLFFSVKGVRNLHSPEAKGLEKTKKWFVITVR